MTPLNYVICNPAHTNDENVQHFLGNRKCHSLPILLLQYDALQYETIFKKNTFRA